MIQPKVLSYARKTSAAYKYFAIIFDLLLLTCVDVLLAVWLQLLGK